MQTKPVKIPVPEKADLTALGDRVRLGGKAVQRAAANAADAVDTNKLERLNRRAHRTFRKLESLLKDYREFAEEDIEVDPDTAVETQALFSLASDATKAYFAHGDVYSENDDDES